jgi:hypothetical protein
MLLKSSKQHQVRLNTRSPSIEVVAVFGGVMPNKRFEGRSASKLRLPSPRPSSCTLGGNELICKFGGMESRRP